MNNFKRKKIISWGVASLILGIVGLLLVMLPYIGLIYSILALIFQGVQRKYNPTGLATAGLVLGILGTIFNTIILFIGVVMAMLYF